MGGWRDCSHCPCRHGSELAAFAGAVRGIRGPQGNYYRGDGRWYRDGRYWGRDDYQRRYYYRRDRDRDDDDLLKGAVVGAAVVGVAVAIAKSNDD